MTKVQKETLIGLLRTTVRETAWAVVKHRREHGLITEGVSASISAYDSACAALRYVDLDGENFILSTYRVR